MTTFPKSLTNDLNVNDDLDFTKLLGSTPQELLSELVDTITNLCRLTLTIGYLRGDEIRDPKGPAKSERVEAEAQRAIYDEKKWLIIRIMDFLNA